MAYQSLAYDPLEKSYSTSVASPAVQRSMPKPAPMPQLSQVGTPTYFEDYAQPPLDYVPPMPIAPPAYYEPSRPRFQAQYAEDERVLRLSIPTNTILYILLGICGLLVLFGLVTVGRGGTRTVYIRKR